MDAIIYLFFALIGIVITAIVFTWYFRPAKKGQYQRLQTAILLKMAEQSGVPKADLDALVGYYLHGGRMPTFMLKQPLSTPPLSK